MEKVVRAVHAAASRARDGNGPSIVFLTGAGCSTACGIPDFRSLGGMYDTLRPEVLTASKEQREAMARDPTLVVNWSLFSQNPLPYLELRRPFILNQGAYKPSLAHHFIGACDKRGVLRRAYTQNIDGLDYAVDCISRERIIPVHGSLSQAACENCNAPMDFDAFKAAVKENIKNIYEPNQGPPASKPIVCKECSLPLVKPTTVLYGRSLPETFFDNAPADTAAADILFVVGTSLSVSPANQLVSMCSHSSTLRVLVNAECVGQDLGFSPSTNTNDVFLSGPADETLFELAQALGWESDLFDARESMAERSASLFTA